MTQQHPPEIKAIIAECPYRDFHIGITKPAREVFESAGQTPQYEIPFWVAYNVVQLGPVTRKPGDQFEIELHGHRMTLQIEPDNKLVTCWLTNEQRPLLEAPPLKPSF